MNCGKLENIIENNNKEGEFSIKTAKIDREVCHWLKAYKSSKLIERNTLELISRTIPFGQVYT